MSNLLNYLPCPKCLNYSSNMIQLDIDDKEDDLFLQLSCVKNCSINFIKFSELKNILNKQEKLPISIFLYGKFSKEQTQIENISTKIFNHINKIYSDIETLEKKIIKIKEEIKNVIDKYKKNFEIFQLLHELIYGSYLKNIKDNIQQDNNLNLNNNLKFININNIDNYNIHNNFYLKEIEKDIINIDDSLNFIKNEMILYLQNNKIISINKNNINKKIFPLVINSNINSNKNEKNNIIYTYKVNLKKIDQILQLSDGNIALGSCEEMIIYNLEIKKEIINIPGDFSDISELKYNKIYKNNKNNKNIFILSVQNKVIKIYDIYNKSILLNYSQYYRIDNILELYNGDILYICDFSIHNINLTEEFKIYLKYFCFAMINLYDKQNILGYSNLSRIKFVNLDNPKKVINDIEVKDSREIYDLKQVYDENNNINYLIILSDKFLDIYDLNINQFQFKSILTKEKVFKKIFLHNNDYNKNIFFNLIGENSVELYNIKNNKCVYIHTIDSLKKKISPLYCKIIVTPFCIENKGKYLLIFESNEEGFNIL